MATLEERQLVDKPGIGDVDVLGVAREGDLAVVQLFPLRGGRLGERFSFTLENASGATLDDLVEAFVAERYDSAGASVPPLIALDGELDEREALEALLTERRGSRVEIRRAQRGEKRRLVELAQRNAELTLRQELLAGERGRGRRLGALEDLREALNLEALPHADRVLRHLQHDGGRDDGVDGRLRARDAEEVRLPHLRHRAERRAGRLRVDVRGDLAPLRAARQRDGGRPVVRGAARPRRHRRRQGAAQRGARGDGGARRRRAAPPSGSPSGWRRSTCPDGRRRSCSDDDDPGLLLLRRIRDEAHRFALTHHRKRRSREASTSLFDALPGVGPARKRALLRHFRTPSAILDASAEELEAVPGLPAPTARAIYAHLHRMG